MVDKDHGQLPNPPSSNNSPSNEEASSSSRASMSGAPYGAWESLRGLTSEDHLEVGEDEDQDKPITVLLFGKAGEGKSTVGNMLLEGQVKGFFGATDNPSKQISGNKQWEVIDTVGLFSPGNRTSDSRLIDKLYDYLVRECPEIDIICYVKKASKYTGADEICLNHFKRMFKGHEVKQNVLLVFTSCPDEITFFKFNDHLISKHMGVEYKKRVGVEFPPTNGNVDLEEMMKQKRSSSLKDLEKQMKRIVSECVGPVVLKRADHFSCYNTLNLFKQGDGLVDYVRQSITDSDSPLFRRV